MSETRSNTRKTKELKVIELRNQGLSYRRIASTIHLSLRDVTRLVNLASNKFKSPSVTSIHDEIILEYRVNLLRSQVRDLELQRDNLDREVKDLRAQEYYNLLNQVRARQTELDAVKWNLKYEKFSRELLNGIFTEDQFHIP